MNSIALLGGALLCGCAVQPASSAAPATGQQQQSILVGSTPAAGSTVQARVTELKLRFDPPARLHELTVVGDQATMPMMVTAVGEVPDYTIPLSGLGPGSYTINWRASARGKEYRGSFQFTVR
ncbi:MAG TPA: copper resistance CopC family protein [Sphingomicrobium sp.]|nr:copper resistance CopC family protein [Sphingomicrobium sp.]